MAFVRREIYTKNTDLQRYLDHLVNHSFVAVPPSMALEIGRMKSVRDIRNRNANDPLILIGHDRKANVSMIQLCEPVKIKKIGDRYVFSL